MKKVAIVGVEGSGKTVMLADEEGYFLAPKNFGTAAYGEWETWRPILAVRPADTFCNLMIVLIQQCRYLLDKMLKWQEADFIKNGGVRERMHAARTEARVEQWDKAIPSPARATFLSHQVRFGVARGAAACDNRGVLDQERTST
ncbi:MAG: four helix bundle suffix domain-containing protein [Kiritimatiellae bacterium]|nr:four helix bundle suffix domain-containing protein [Kiritimatiellia bacterium]